jgi:hypothetical protein
LSPVVRIERRARWFVRDHLLQESNVVPAEINQTRQPLLKTVQQVIALRKVQFAATEVLQVLGRAISQKHFQEVKQPFQPVFSRLERSRSGRRLRVNIQRR